MGCGGAVMVGGLGSELRLQETKGMTLSARY